MSKSYLTCVLLFVSLVAQAQTDPIDSNRKITWNPGMSGDIPDRTTICDTISAYSGTSATINTAIAGCGSGEVVFLSAGTFTLTTDLNIFRSDVTLRGAGPDQTKLIWTASSGCFIGGALVCIVGGNGIYPLPPNQTANWTASYTKGTTSITLDNTTNLDVGDLLVLDQLNDTDTDNDEVWVCSTTNVCSSEGPSGISRASREQMQVVVVTDVSGSTVTFTPGLYMPNWRSGRSPGAWWSDSNTLTGIGLEDLSIENQGSSAQSNIFINNTRDSWVRNVRSIFADRAAVWCYGSGRVTIRDSYIYGTLVAESQSYGIVMDICSNWLVENNIFDGVAIPMPAGLGAAGIVWGYNYALNDIFVSGGNEVWMQASNYHHATANQFHLIEGGDGIGFTADQIHGTSHFATLFRNHWLGYDPEGGSPSGKEDQLVAVHIYFGNRFFNVIGNVLGRTGTHTMYQRNPASATESTASPDQNISIYMLGWSANQEKHGSFDNDMRVAETIMRWGNWDIVSDAVRWESSEVPSGDSFYPNAVPGDQTLINSYYLASKPAWFTTLQGTVDWPPIGPDVTGGAVSDAGGHVNKIPARLCYESLSDDSDFTAGTVRVYDYESCYLEGAGGPGSTVSGSVKLSGTVTVQ